MESGSLDDDECAVLLDALMHWRETVAATYDADDQDRYIAAANRLAERVGCTFLDNT